MPTRDAFKDAQVAVARCPHIALCRQECPSMAETEPPHHEPKPDFIGKRYGKKYPKLLIIGGNPGGSDKAKRRDYNQKMRQNMNNIKADGSDENFETLMRDLKESFGSRFELMNARHQEELSFDPDNIAYVNLVKCATKKHGGGTKSLVKPSVFDRCWQTHTENQIKILNPDFVICLWKQNEQTLKNLGVPHNRHFASYNGNRKLKLPERYKEVKKLIEEWKAAR